MSYSDNRALSLRQRALVSKMITKEYRSWRRKKGEPTAAQRRQITAIGFSRARQIDPSIPIANPTDLAAAILSGAAAGTAATLASKANYNWNPLLMTVMGANPLGYKGHRISKKDIAALYRIALKRCGGDQACARKMVEAYLAGTSRMLPKRNPPVVDVAADGALQLPVIAANPVSGPVDLDAARELELFIENDADLHRQQEVPIMKNLMLKRAKGIFDPEKAVKLYMYLMESGARKYIQQFGTPGQRIDMVFNRKTQEYVARRFMESFVAEADLGNYDHFLSKRNPGLPCPPYCNNPKHGHKRRVAMNPGKRKITMSIQKFLVLLRRKGTPEMIAAFKKKVAGYRKWTHGALPKTVTLETAQVPGVDGLWITYDAGKEPEGRYIMPKGSKRTGAWKHPWDTMPSLKHDPEAGIVIKKLHGKSKISDFYHR